jgi:hypothetical protein
LISISRRQPLAWFEPIVEENAPAIGTDFKNLVSGYVDPLSKQAFVDSFRIFLFWKRGNLARGFQLQKNQFIRFKAIKPFHAVQSFMFSYITIFAGGAKIDALLDEMHLWRLGRAVSVTLFFGGAVAYIGFLELLSRDSLGIHHPVAPVIPLLLYLFLLAFSVFVTRRSYLRMCGTVFSLAYVTHKQLAEKQTHKA